MHRRQFNDLVAGAGLSYFLNPINATNPEKIKVGVIGLDTSHAIAFTKIINEPPEGHDADFLVTHAYPQGSRDIESSITRIPGYIEDIKKLGVAITDSIQSLLDQVDVVLLETNDGRLHLEQAIEVFESGKAVFIDKPIAASLSDTIEIFKVAAKHQVPVFSASSLRYSPSTQEVAQGKIGKILGADTYSPAKLEKTHPDLYWYGIHGVESLYTVMGTGCKQVRRIFRDDMEVVIGEWNDGRIGTFRGVRSEKGGYGGVAFGSEGIAPVGGYEGYQHLVIEILKFFKSGVSPIDPAETIELFAFMSAADRSKKDNGAVVTLESVMPK